MRVLCAVLLSLWLTPDVAFAYPTDVEAQELTKIRRLRWQQDINEGKRRGRKIPDGAQWPMSAMKLRMLENKAFDLTAETVKDEFLQAGLQEILKRWKWRRYNVAILDITDPKNPRFAGVNESALQTPGSTAKVLLGAGLLNALKERFPDSVDKRMEMLRSTLVGADDFAMPNHHEVPVIYGGDIYADEAYKSSIRSVRRGDTFSLWEWMDHALSPSSNACASMLWREATVMRLLGEEYPPEKYDPELFKRWEREDFTKAVFDAVDKPLVDADLGTEDFFIRMFFTRGAGKYIKSEASRASPLGMLRWLLRVEQGRMVDEWSSLELKKMLYLTRRRIRYAYSPKLNSSATFFKTGSLYKCQPEEGYSCGAYRGNAVNVLNALITIETPPTPPEPTAEEAAAAKEAAAKEAAAKEAAATEAAAKTKTAKSDAGEPPVVEEPEPIVIPDPQYVYMVTVMSNELKRNAATDHSTLAGEIHALIENAHAPPPADETANQDGVKKDGADAPPAPKSN